PHLLPSAGGLIGGFFLLSLSFLQSALGAPGFFFADDTGLAFVPLTFLLPRIPAGGLAFVPVAFLLPGVSAGGLAFVPVFLFPGFATGRLSAAGAADVDIPRIPVIGQE